MTLSVMQLVVKPSGVMLVVTFFYYSASVIMLNVVVLSVIMLNVDMLSVVEPENNNSHRNKNL
jgi:hypothetical protein